MCRFELSKIGQCVIAGARFFEALSRVMRVYFMRLVRGLLYLLASYSYYETVMVMYM